MADPAASGRCSGGEGEGRQPGDGGQAPRGGDQEAKVYRLGGTDRTPGNLRIEYRRSTDDSAMRRFMDRLPRLPQWVLPALTVIISIVTMVNVFLLARVSKDGTAARKTQCDVFPISIKVYTAAAK